MSDDELNPDAPAPAAAETAAETAAEGSGDGVTDAENTAGRALATLAAADGGAAPTDKALYSVPIEVIVSVGRARPMIKDVLSLRRDSVLPLDSRIEDPVEIYVGPKLVARGELQELDDDSGRLGVRLTEVVSLADVD